MRFLVLVLGLRRGALRRLFAALRYGLEGQGVNEASHDGSTAGALRHSTQQRRDAIIPKCVCTGIRNLNLCAEP